METSVEESELLRNVRELKSELSDLKQNRSSTATHPAASSGDLHSQLAMFEEDQKVARQQLEAQSSAMSQLQQHMHRIEQLCVKLSSDVATLTAKA